MREREREKGVRHQLSRQRDRGPPKTGEYVHVIFHSVDPALTCHCSFISPFSYIYIYIYFNNINFPNNLTQTCVIILTHLFYKFWSWLWRNNYYNNFDVLCNYSQLMVYIVIEWYIFKLSSMFITHNSYTHAHNMLYECMI